MIVFKLLSFNFMCDDKTINLDNKTLTVNYNIDFLYLNFIYYHEQDYKSNIQYKIFIKKYKLSNSLSLISKWDTFINYWNDSIKDYNKAFNIKFDTLKLNNDYLLAPIYITENTIYIGIILLNIDIINNNFKKKSYNFLSEIKPYQCKNKLNLNKYNFINGILNKTGKINKDNKEFILDKDKKIPLNYIFQNSLNYIPNLEIIRVKKNFQNLLNP